MASSIAKSIKLDPTADLAFPKTGRQEKMGNEKSGGFSSKLEESVYFILQALVKSGIAKDLITQVNVHLTSAKILFIPDFRYTLTKSDSHVYVEAKGFQTAVYRIKRRLWMHYGPAPLQVWAGNYRRPFLTETIIPKGVGSD